MPPENGNPKSEQTYNRKVMGTFFVDYVRMLRSRKDLDWSPFLNPEDLPYLKERIIPDQWYPMASFERLGLAILAKIAGGNNDLVRLWGRAQADAVARQFPEIVHEGDPRESMINFQVERGSYFNFDAVKVLAFFRNYVKLEIAYHMSPPAEQAACWQTLGYFERLLELSRATNIFCRFTGRSWAGDPATILEIDWSNVTPDRKVKGALFLDYVRMIKGHRKIAWERWLRPEDLAIIDGPIDEKEWYPMESFERMGAGILKEVAFNDLERVRLWGRLSVSVLIKTNPDLISPGEPIETLYRFQVLRRSFFNFSAIDIKALHGTYAKLQIDYDMSRTTEAAATYQAIGFFEQLLELAGAKKLQAQLTTKSWEGDPTTILELKWS